MGDNQTSFIVGIIILAVVVSIGAYYFAAYGDERLIVEESSSTNLTPATSLTNTLQAEEGITSKNLQTAENVSLSFDGVNDVVTLSISPNTSGGYTFLIWANPRSNSSRIRTFHSQNDAIYSVMYGAAGENYQCLLTNGSDSGFNDQIAFSDKLGQWSNLGCRFNGSAIVSILNSFDSGSPTNVNGVPKAFTTAKIASSFVGGEYFNGSLDEIKFYNRSLLNKDIRELYNQSKYGTGLGKAVVILNYHEVASGQATGSNVNISQFTEQIEYLKSIGAETITYQELDNWKNGIGNIPERTYIINFDDSASTVYENAEPILTANGFIASWSLITNNVGSGNNVSWEQVSELKEKGWEFISHGSINIDATYVEDLDAWFNDSRNHIKSNLSLLDYPVAFVYPHAISNSTIDEICLQYYTYCINKTSNFDEQIQYNHKSNVNNLTIVRVTSIGNTTTLDNFKKIGGIYESLVFNYNLNSNNGTIAYDSSGNNNHGTISGATWQSDGYKTLVEGVDYTLNSATGLLTLSSDYLYSWVSVVWEYYSGESNQDYNVAKDAEEGLGEFGNWFVILVIISIAGFVLYILFNRDDMAKGSY